MVNNLLNKEAPAISLETAVQMLVNAGFPIEDAVEEVNRIRQNDFSAAEDMLAATGDVNAVRARLGLPPITPPTGEPVPTLDEDIEP